MRRNGAPVPYGYRREGGQWAAAEHQAATVKRIFEAFNAGASLRGVAAELNAGSVPHRKGAAWYPAQVRYILDNGLYAGMVQYKGNEGVSTAGIPAIVSRAQYDAAGARLARLTRGNPTFDKGRITA